MWCQRRMHTVLLRIMKISALYFVSALAVVIASESCHREVNLACSTSSSSDSLCNATYGSSDIVMKNLIDFTNIHIVRSFEYLMMSTHYGNYLKNRAGFEKLFRSLSDSKWKSAVKLIQYITKRGGEMQILPPRNLNIFKKHTNEYELYEIQSIAKALDMEKKLAQEAFLVHKFASQFELGRNDPEITSYIEKEFVHEHAQTIRKLSGYVSDLTKLLSVPDASLALFLFDEYLQEEYGRSMANVIHSRKRPVYNDFLPGNNDYFH